MHIIEFMIADKLIVKVTGGFNLHLDHNVQVSELNIWVDFLELLLLTSFITKHVFAYLVHEL